MYQFKLTFYSDAPKSIDELIALKPLVDISIDHEYESLQGPIIDARKTVRNFVGLFGLPRNVSIDIYNNGVLVYSRTYFDGELVMTQNGFYTGRRNENLFSGLNRKNYYGQIHLQSAFFAQGDDIREYGLFVKKQVSQ